MNQYLLGALALARSTTLDAAEPVQLFNGNDLSGWTQKGGKAKFTAENGEIVGTAVASSPNSFLCSSVKTWLNGVPAADLQNDLITSGFIGLQVHEVSKDEPALHVRFKNLQLQELP